MTWKELREIMAKGYTTKTKNNVEHEIEEKVTTKNYQGLQRKLENIIERWMQ